MYTFIVSSTNPTTPTSQHQESKTYLCPPRRSHSAYSSTNSSSISFSISTSTSTQTQTFRRRTPRAGLSSTPPKFPSFHPNNNDDLHWKDRVALYAQFSAEETLHALLHALQSNAGTGPHKDDGIDALYAFANVDIWELSHRFFGKTQDLGQFERFKRVVVAHPYNILLRNDYESQTLSALYVTPDTYVVRREFECGGEMMVFTFTMCRMEFGGKRETRAWMVDSIILDEQSEL